MWEGLEYRRPTTNGRVLCVCRIRGVLFLGIWVKPCLCGATNLAPVVLLNDFNRLGRTGEPAGLNIKFGAHSSRSHSLGDLMGRLNLPAYHMKIDLWGFVGPQLIEDRLRMGRGDSFPCSILRGTLKA